MPTESQCRSCAEPESHRGHPTVLVLGDDPRSLIPRLRQQGYLVLEAFDCPGALEIVVRHSRPIQLLLIEENLDSRRMAEVFNRFRPEMKIIFLASERNEVRADVLTPEKALTKARAILARPEPVEVPQVAAAAG